MEEIIRKCGDKVNVMDTEDGLQILNYVQCDNQSEEDLKKMRGVVQEVDSGKILFESFPYTEEYESTEKQLWSEKLGALEDWDAYYSLEGTLLRIFYYGTKWYISTNKKLNAYKSRWSSRKSFGDMFHDGMVALTKDEHWDSWFFDLLDPTQVYFFLVRYNHENRVVCQVERDPVKQIVFIGRSPLETFQLEKTWDHSEKVPFYVSEPISKQNLEEEIEKIDTELYQGIIFFHKTKNIQVKVVNPEYKRLFQIRGNNPNIRFRYLEVRLDPELRNKFLSMYPLSQDLFLEYENILYQIAKLVRIYYIQRYIKNKYVTLPKEEYILMKKCHEWYLSNRDEHRINVSKVLEILNQEDVLSLYKMIRRYQLYQTQTQENGKENPHSRILDSSFRVRPMSLRMTSPMEMMMMSDQPLCN